MPGNVNTANQNLNQESAPANIINMMTGGGAENEEIEIDLLELFFELRRHILIIMIAAILGGGLGYAVSKFVLTPTYTSTSMIYVMSRETTLTSLADLQIGSQLTQDYRVLCTSRTVMEDVISRLNLDMDYLQLRNKITINNPQNTRILNISVLDTSPQRAKQLSDSVAECASNYIADIMEQDPPKIIEYGEIPLRTTGPKTMRNSMIAALFAAMLVVAGVTISMLTNDAIRTEDDIEKYFGLPVLAVIPERNSEAARKAENYSYRSRQKKKEGK